MKQTIFDSGNITGSATSDSRIFASIEWQGGSGWLVVPSFGVVTGTPRIDITEQSFVGQTPFTPFDLPASITTMGVFPFFAPKGSLLNFELVAAPGEQVSFSNIHLLGDV